MQVPIKYVLTNWAGLVALWGPAYLAMLEYLRLEVARSEILHWTLLAVGVFGICSALYISWQDTRGRKWRRDARSGLRTRSRAFGH